MNGNISVTSTVGQGSIFEITLPNVNVSATESVDTPDKVFNFKDISFEKAIVLVVDEIKSNRHLIKEYLSQVNKIWTLSKPKMDNQPLFLPNNITLLSFK